MEKNIFRKIYEKHSRFLKHRKVRSNKRLIICFSGISGSGKTSLAKILEKRYKGVRVNSHRVGKIIRELIILGFIKKKSDAKKLQDDYQLWLIGNSQFRNCLIILDRGIDRKYEEVFRIAGKRGYKVFIIRLNVSEKTLRKRILIKNKENAENYFKSFDRWKREFREFGKKIKSDIILENEEKPDLKLLFRRLDKLVT